MRVSSTVKVDPRPGSGPPDQRRRDQVTDQALLAGIPRGHRRVARAMRFCPSGLPWQRVVGKKDARRAQINIQDPEHAARQRAGA